MRVCACVCEYVCVRARVCVCVSTVRMHTGWLWDV